MNPSIPSSAIVNLTPAVIASGGTGGTMSGTILSTATAYGCNVYTSADAVKKAFSIFSTEYKMAVIYFASFNNADKTPSKLYISKVNTADTNAVLIGGSLAGVTLTQLQAIKGTLTITVDGTAETANVDLSTATSFSNGAELITEAFTSKDLNVMYSSALNAFLVTTVKTGATASISYADGTTAYSLGLSQEAGAVLNNYTTADTTAETIMQKVTDYTLDFTGITHTDDAFFTTDIKKLVATWVNSQGGAYWFVPWGKESGAITANNSASLGGWLQANSYSGTTPIYGTYDKGALALTYPASLDWSLLNGNTTLDFRNQDGLTADVTDKTTADALVSNGYMFYGAYANAVNRYLFFRNSIVSGRFKWIQKYIINARLRASFVDSFITMFMAKKSIPYNASGKAVVRAYGQDTIDEMINFGGIQAGVTLTNGEKNTINTAVGSTGAADQIFALGWYLYIGDATADERNNRTSFPMIFYYTDGDSLQSLSMQVTNVQ